MLLHPLPTMVPFGKLPDGRVVHQATLRHASGLVVRAITYGGIITAIQMPDERTRNGNIVLGHATLDGYLTDRNYLGAVIGRYGNRIARGRCPIDGTTYQLDANDGRNHLHGGHNGYNRRVWNVDDLSDTALVLSLIDPHGACGYPGTLQAMISYRISDRNALHVEYAAETEAPTVVNLTQHSYFNLSGGATRSIDDHVLRVDGDRYLPVDDELIPTGEVKEVAGTSFDFRSMRRIGSSRYDHNWALNGIAGTLRLVATLADPGTGRSMDVLTTEPGIQFYTGHLLDTPRSGLCLETQHYPDSPNHPEFPPTVLRPSEHYTSTTVYRFEV